MPPETVRGGGGGRPPRRDRGGGPPPPPPAAAAVRRRGGGAGLVAPSSEVEAGVACGGWGEGGEARVRERRRLASPVLPRTPPPWATPHTPAKHRGTALSTGRAVDEGGQGGRGAGCDFGGESVFRTVNARRGAVCFLSLSPCEGVQPGQGSLGAPTHAGSVRRNAVILRGEAGAAVAEPRPDRPPGPAMGLPRPPQSPSPVSLSAPLPHLARSGALGPAGVRLSRVGRAAPLAGERHGGGWVGSGCGFVS